jgi:hypothetical protein
LGLKEVVVKNLGSSERTSSEMMHYAKTFDYTYLLDYAFNDKEAIGITDELLNEKRLCVVDHHKANWDQDLIAAYGRTEPLGYGYAPFGHIFYDAGWDKSASYLCYKLLPGCEWVIPEAIHKKLSISDTYQNPFEDIPDGYDSLFESLMIKEGFIKCVEHKTRDRLINAMRKAREAGKSDLNIEEDAPQSEFDQMAYRLDTEFPMSYASNDGELIVKMTALASFYDSSIGEFIMPSKGVLSLQEIGEEAYRKNIERMLSILGDHNNFSESVIEFEGKQFLRIYVPTKEGKVSSVVMRGLARAIGDWDGAVMKILDYSGDEKLITIYAGIDEDFNYTTIATKYGGGGHPGACGFKINHQTLSEKLKVVT